MDNKADEFLRGLFTLERCGTDDCVRHTVSRCFLDYLGATLAGSRILGKRGNSVMDMLGLGSPECTIVGFGRKGSLHTASFINGLSAHTAELDDGVIAGIIHPGAPVFTALMAVCERNHLKFDRFCIGAIVGYESSVRLAKAIQPSHKKLGYHASATCGLIGAAMSVGAALGYTFEEQKRTLSAAIASAHGTLKVLEDNSELKPFNVASAASDAIVAACIGKCGFEGPNDPLSGNAGFLQRFSDDIDESLLYRRESDSLCLDEVYVKPYAACRYCHPSIENALKLRASNEFSVEDISDIEVQTYSLAVNKHDRTDISNISSAKMSIPFGAAVALCRGSASVDAYCDETIANEMICRTMKKVRVIPNNAFSKSFPAKSIATMRIRMTDGRVLEERTDEPKGESTAPLSDRELCDKFSSLARYAGIDKKATEEVVTELMEPCPDFCRIMERIL